MKSNFNVSDGWDGSLARGAAIQRVFDVHSTHKYLGGTPLNAGSIVFEQSDGTVKTIASDAEQQYTAASGAPTVPTNNRLPSMFWMVVSGNTQYEYDGRELDKVVCLRGNFTVETEYVFAALDPGDVVCSEIVTGKLKKTTDALDASFGRCTGVKTVNFGDDTVYEIEMTLNG